VESVTKILLVGGHATLMGSIAARLEHEHHCTVVGIFGTPEDAAKVLAERPADILLVDIDGMGRTCLSSLETLRAAHPDLRIILISATIDDAHIKQALKLGVNGFLPKDEVPTTIAKAIQEVRAGGAWFPEAVRSRLIVDSGGLRLTDTVSDEEGGAT
jgi:DNA-binding NarL/FixJ family response regulator